MLAWLYQRIGKPILFRFDPERVHQRAIVAGRFVARHRLLRRVTERTLSYRHPALEQTIAGIHFPNPVGLSAGFDKNAELIDTMAMVGFGFTEVGSITAEPYAGNPRPRLWRLPEVQGLRVHIGLANAGAEVIAQRLERKHYPIPFGISIAKINDLAEYSTVAERFRDIGQYITLNISCPNVSGGKDCQQPAALETLLSAYNQLGITKPVFVKISPDLDFALVDQLLDCMIEYHVTGVICSNLTKNSSTVGGISGKPAQAKSLALVRHIRQRVGQQLVIIGVGGIFSAEDAYTYLQAGASLVQLITGMIYQGPQLIGDINRGVVRLLRRDGYQHISQAIGRALL